MKHRFFLHRTLPLLVLVVATLSCTIPAAALLRSAPQDTQPTVATFSKNGPVSSSICFSPEDFHVEAAGKLALDCVILTALPDLNAGVLTLGGAELVAGDVVAMSAVSGMRFQPLATPTVASTSFSFTPVFSDGTAGSQVTAGLYLLSAANRAPIAENLELCTYRDVAITARFEATDPEGDLITFKLVDKPARGSVTMPEEGSDTFVYTPYEHKTGKDAFTYVAVDAVGNTSAPASVKVKIEKASTKVTYADMPGVPAYKAAIRLAEEGVFVGECLGKSYFFQPDLPVSRSSFVAMAMASMGLDALEGVTSTGFADDVVIPTWAKPYVSSALKAGLVQGSSNEAGQVVFLSENPITKAEAAVLLNRILQISDVSTETWYADSDLAPAWAYQSAMNLEQCGVIHTTAEGALGLDAQLTRAEAAEMLCAALTVLDNRETGSWLHW